MGRPRTTYMGAAATLSLAAVGLLVAALIVTNWQYITDSDSGDVVIRYGLWRYKECDRERRGLLPPYEYLGCKDPVEWTTFDYPTCDKEEMEEDEYRDCEDHKKAILAVKIGLLIQVSISGLFVIYALMRISKNFGGFLEGGLLGWAAFPLPLLGAIAAAICWGMYYEYNPYRESSDAHWGAAFWIAMAAWICGLVAWVPRAYYSFR